MKLKRKYNLALIVLLIFGCETITETQVTISGRYDNATDMILWLEESNSFAEADLLWSGRAIHLIGRYSKQHLILSGTLDGKNLTLDLWYKDRSLAGGYTYTDGTKAVKFYYRESLVKKIIHDQGG